ncbi:substrate-binding periplasmic protein [Desulfonema magnum]|nr:transporter substrate-binding domain-containing protein [Desulfonema magnum]
MSIFSKTGFILFLTLSLSAFAFGQDIKIIHVVTPSWEGFTNKDGTGLFFDIVRKVYEPVGIKMKHEIVPWEHAETMVGSGKADAMLSVAVQNIGKEMLAPKYPMVIEYTVAVFKKSKIGEWRGLETLGGRQAIWIHGYDFHKNPNIRGIKLKWSEVDTHGQAWDMLKKDKTEVLMDALAGIEYYIRKNNIDFTPFGIEPLWGEKMYMAFSKSERSEKLIEIYDKRIMKLVNSGELKKIFEKWDLYPFPPDAWKE